MTDLWSVVVVNFFGCRPRTKSTECSNPIRTIYMYLFWATWETTNH